MKYFKIVCIVLLLALTPQTCYCQIGKGVSRAAKSILKRGARETGEEAAKKGSKRAAKKAGKNIAEKTTQELAGESAEMAIRRNSAKSLTRNGKKAKNSNRIHNDMTLELASSFEKGFAKRTERAVARSSGIGVAAAGLALTDRELVKKLGPPETKATIEQFGKQELKKGSQKAAGVKHAVRAGKTFVGSDALKALDDVPALKRVVLEFNEKFSTALPVDQLVVKKSGKHLIAEYPGTSTKIEIKGNKIFATGGSTPANGAMNEFLNSPLPNSTYLVDGHTTYITDGFGKTISVECHSSELAKSVKRTELAAQNQAPLVELKGGKRGVHDSGHIQQRSTGGNNESINLLPMKSSLQKGGKWAKMERTEREAIKSGADVVTHKKITYRPDGSYTIDVEMKITDPVKGKVNTKKWSFSDLF